MAELVIVLVLVILVLLFVVVINKKNPAADPKNVGKISTSAVVDYGNGVYYFNYTGTGFGNALSTFLSEHRELELLSMTGDGTGAYGSDDGYFVVFRTKR
jgi:hypothetical protein